MTARPDKFTDDTIEVGQIMSRDETEYRKEIKCFVQWCQDNILLVSVSKIKELVTDLRNQGGILAPVTIKGVEAEIVDSYMSFGRNITNHIDEITKKAHAIASTSTKVIF